MVHDVWVGVIFHDPYVTGPWAWRWKQIHGIKPRNRVVLEQRAMTTDFKMGSLVVTERRVVSWLCKKNKGVLEV